MDKPVDYMHMGSDLLDLLVGGAKGVMGLPYGCILNLIGDKSSGKSFLKNEIIASNYHQLGDRFQWFSDDTETGDTFDTTNLYGFDIRAKDKDGNLHIGKKKVEDSETVEGMDAQVSLFLEYLNTLPKDVCAVYAVDSLDGLSDSTRLAMEGNRLGQLKSGKDVKDPGDYGAQIAKFLSQQFFRLKHKKLEDMKCSLILVSQIRDKMNALGFGPKWDVSNGRALEFYCHTRIFLTTIRKIEKDGRVIGAYVSAKTIKSKTPRPFREVRYTVYFDYGIDNTGSGLDYLYDLRDKEGKLTEAAEAIKWQGGQEATNDALKEWLTSQGYMEQCKADRKTEAGSTALSGEFMTSWIAKDPEILAKYEQVFGKCYTRDQLIQMCEDNPDMAKELTARVIAKWEAAEDAVATHRKKKYN